MTTCCKTDLYEVQDTDVKAAVVAALHEELWLPLTSPLRHWRRDYDFQRARPLAFLYKLFHHLNIPQTRQQQRHLALPALVIFPRTTERAIENKEVLFV